MKQKQEHPNPSCKAHRKLTRRELRAIEEYALHPEVEKRVVEDWKSRAYSRISEYRENKSFLFWISKAIHYLLPVLLWLLYLDPGHTVMNAIFSDQGPRFADIVLQISIVFSWINVVIAVPIAISYFMMRLHVLRDPWNPMYLKMWKGPSLIRRCITIAVRLSIVIGLAVNGWYILSSCMVVAYALIFFARRSVREIVDRQMYYCKQQWID